MSYIHCSQLIIHIQSLKIIRPHSLKHGPNIIKTCNKKLILILIWTKISIIKISSFFISCLNLFFSSFKCYKSEVNLCMWDHISSVAIGFHRNDNSNNFFIFNAP